MVNNNKSRIFLKTTFKLIKERYIRFILNILIVLISVSLTAGIGSLEDAYSPAYASNFEKGHAPDVILKYIPEGSETTLWTDERIKQLQDNVQGIKKITSLLSVDKKDESSENYRVQIFKDLKEENGIGLPVLSEGEYPANPLSTETIDGKTYYVFESLLLEGIDKFRNHKLGDYVKMDGFYPGVHLATKVVGYASSVLTTSKQKERAMSEEEYYIDNTYFSSFTFFGMLAYMLSPSDLYVSLTHTGNYLSNTYKNEINAYKASIEEVFGSKVKNINPRRKYLLCVI